MEQIQYEDMLSKPLWSNDWYLGDHAYILSLSANTNAKRRKCKNEREKYNLSL